jgi:integrase
MRHVSPDFLNRSREAFGDAKPLTMAAIKELASADTTLTPTQRRDFLSALQRVQDWFQVRLEALDATAGRMRGLFANVTASQLRVSEKTLANVRSLVAKAVRRYSKALPTITKRVPFDASWIALLGLIPVKFQRCALSRLARYCSAMQIAPEQVTRDTLIGLHAALEAEEVVKNPRSLLHNTVSNWNRSRRNIPGWPQTGLSSPFLTEPFTLPLSALTREFQQDIVCWQERMLRPDPLDEEAPARPLRAVTVQHRTIEFRQFASALVRSGRVPLKEITSIRVLVDPDNFKAALRVFLDRTGRTQRVHNLARSMRLIGKHHCHLSNSTLEALDKLCHRLDPGNRRRLTEKNRRRLGQFDDQRNVIRLLQLPSREAARAKSQTNPLRAAKRMEGAVAISLLLHCGLRGQTLRMLELSDFRWMATNKCQLMIRGDKTKNGRPLEFELDGEAVILIKSFIAQYRTQLPGADGPYLFLGRSGGPRSKCGLYANIRATVRKQTGLEMNPHLFRHVIAKIAVEADPGAYFAVSRVLGHASMTTTMGHYLGTESKAAGKHLDKLLSGVKDKAK